MKKQALKKRSRKFDKRRCSQQNRLEFSPLEPRKLLAADVFITEFLASNDSVIVDGNGASSDFIEIFNAGDQPVDLSGYHLTDDSAELDKYEFPSLSESIIDPGEFLVVFASGDGVPDPDGNLHTNFSLSSSGEYLALTRPDLSVVSEFGVNGADFPAQRTDVSFGFQGGNTQGIQYFDADEEPGGNTTGLVGPNVFVPRGAGAGGSGDSRDFGNGGGTLQADGDVQELATTISGLDPNQTYEVFAFFWSVDGGPNWNLQAGLTSGDLTDYDAASPGVFQIDATTQVPGGENFVSGLNVLGETGDTNGFADFIDGNRTLHAVRVGEVTGDSVTLFVDHDETLSQRSFYDGVGLRATGEFVSPDSPAEYLVPQNGNLGLSYTQNGFDAAAAGFNAGFASIGYENGGVDPLDGNETSFAPLIETTIPVGTTSVYLRTNFNVADASTISQLTLSLQYDDGFVAYLNGVEVARDNAPANLAFNSIATSSRPDSTALTPRDFGLSQFTDLLVDGENTLAFHALNRSANSSDFLLVPRLTFSAAEIDTDSAVFFATPTPGAANVNGFQGIVSDTTFSVDRGFFDAAFPLTISTATQDAAIYYTVDGTVPDPSNASALLYTGPITISATTNIRAAAFRNGFLPTDVDTQTYIFLDSVVNQDPLNDNGNGATNNGLVFPGVLEGNFDPQFDLDPEIVNSPEHDDSNGNNTDVGIRESLLSLPTISLTLPHEQFFGELGSSTVGIATDARQRTRYTGSIEYFDPNSNTEFQFNAGIQAHGNSSRRNSSTPKHSFRVTFDGSGGGPGRLNVPIFENSDNDDINAIVLRATFTDGFAARNRNNVTNRFNPVYATSIRGAFLRDTQRDLGGLAPASGYSHLYINGLYWGVYNPSERPDDNFLEANLGGDADDYDVVRGRPSVSFESFRGGTAAFNQLVSVAGGVSSASPSQANVLYQQLQGNFANGTNNPNQEALLDVDNFIDYIILHQWAGVGDFPNGNWYAARNRENPGAGFQFITWDQELSLDQLVRDRTGSTDNGTNPLTIYTDLQNSSEFRLRYADRANALLSNGGALSPEVSQARWDKWVDLVEPAIVAESARWGDTQEGITGDVAFSIPGPSEVAPLIPVGQRATLNGPLTIEDWRRNVDHVRNEVIEHSADILLARLTNRGLFTTIDPPDFQINGTNQFGGSIAGGSQLGISSPANGAIYFTLDGSDPRSLDNTPAGTLFTGQVQLNQSTVVSARTFVNGQWSAVSVATFTSPSDSIVISEINYNPADPTSAEIAAYAAATGTSVAIATADFDNDEFEFIEILNTSDNSVSLLELQLTEGVGFDFGNVTLAAGERAVIVENVDAFSIRYDTTNIRVLGQWSGGLSNGGETITISDSAGAEITSVTYNDTDPFPVSTDGAGATLVLVDDFNTPANETDKYYSYRGSVEPNGTPGQASAAPAGVVINEVLAHTDAPLVDSIELFNPTSSAINLSNYYLSDSGANPLRFAIPAGTVIPAGGYLVFDETDFNPTPQNPGPNDFALNSTVGDQVYLTRGSSDGTTLLGFEDVVEFGATENGVSLGRLPNGSGRLATLADISLGGVNGTHAVGDLVISEINYHPAPPSAAALAASADVTESDLEFIEIFNRSSGTINLVNHRIRGEVDFDFPAINLASGESVVVIRFDPDDPVNAGRTAAFRAQYGISAGVVLVGGFSGSLSNSFGRVTLQAPGDPEVTADGTVIPAIAIDEVLYDDLGPFPVSADGTGNALTRISSTNFGNDGNSFVGATPTPGAVSFQATVGNRYVFFNNSFFDGGSAAANADDDNAIATDKVALLPGQTASFENYTSFSRGINGLIIDISNLADAAALSASDFILATGNGSNLSDFTALSTLPTVSVRPGAGENGADRVTLTLPDGTVTGTWLSVTVRANANTGLATDDLFYFGNAIGETGDNTANSQVNLTDEFFTGNNHRNFLNRAGVENRFDFNRDSLVNALDESLVRNNSTNFVTDLNLIVAPGAPSPALVASQVVQAASGSEQDDVAAQRLTVPTATLLPSMTLTVSEPIVPVLSNESSILASAVPQTDHVESVPLSTVSAEPLALTDAPVLVETSQSVLIRPDFSSSPSSFVNSSLNTLNRSSDLRILSTLEDEGVNGYPESSVVESAYSEPAYSTEIDGITTGDSLEDPDAFFAEFTENILFDSDGLIDFGVDG